MKKLVVLLLVLIMMFTLVACKGNEEVVSEEPVVIEGEMEGGSFIDVEDGTLTDELIAIFNDAQAKWNGIPMEPIKLLKTQVVAGTNYMFLAKQEALNVVTLDQDGASQGESEVGGYKAVVVYYDLEGESMIISVEDYTEEVEE